MSISQTNTEVVTPSCNKDSSESVQVNVNVTIRQDPLTVTLDGFGVFTLALALIATVHFFEPLVVAFLISMVTCVLFGYNDYLNYLKLGPGGTPSTFRGYLCINWLKLWIIRDPFQPLTAPPGIQPSRGILHEKPLPYRCGPRPEVVGIAPQRQVDQFGSRDCYLALRRILQNHGTNHANNIGIGTSCFEKHGLGLFSLYPFNNTCQGEICHVHDSDSMHLNLHPEDAREVLKKGWGQRHPLTSKPWFVRMPVPRQFTMVYAPRSFEELKVVVQIIEAASYWVTAKETNIDVGEEMKADKQGIM
ncbi:hypothetical protein F5Y15DRAFT_17723 [Xylariaceae sp. FL0016]|nr:hypothetical protein F5Y15DRAFT_17723 [Xylariaceae sp. FL0016]